VSTSGSLYDFYLATPTAGASILHVPAGTRNVVVGTDPSGSDLLRVGGSLTVNGSFSFLPVNSGDFSAGRWSRDGNWGTFLRAAASGVIADIAFADSAGTVMVNIKSGAIVLGGTDPGGSELLRIGGSVRVNADLYLAGGFRKYQVSTDTLGLASLSTSCFQQFLTSAFSSLGYVGGNAANFGLLTPGGAFCFSYLPAANQLRANANKLDLVAAVATDPVFSATRSTGEVAIVASISGRAWIGAQSNHPMSLVTNNLERLAITPFGAVTINNSLTLGAGSGTASTLYSGDMDLYTAWINTAYIVNRVSSFSNDKVYMDSAGHHGGLFFAWNGTVDQQVVGARKSGWGSPSGTLSRAAYASYAGQTVSNPPTQAQMQALDDAVKALSQRVAALLTDLHAATSGHGLIGT